MSAKKFFARNIVKYQHMFTLKNSCALRAQSFKYSLFGNFLNFKCECLVGIKFMKIQKILLFVLFFYLENYLCERFCCK